MAITKLWGGRFDTETDKDAAGFHSSIAFDSRMYKQDITGSIAHVRMLGKAGIIPEGDAALIERTLGEVLADIEAGKIIFDPSCEDIHTQIEMLLISRIGDAGKRLHTGRSRNDQVALDIRMYVKGEIRMIQNQIKGLLRALTGKARANTGTIMPGYTHLQRAQPITLAHHLLAYAQMFMRDCGRLEDAYKRTDEMPLGSGALASTTYPIDRNLVAQSLSFAGITQNSMDGVSDRDFLIELTGALSIIMMHLSRFCEEIILWASCEFKFIELSDAYSTGSSIMPQKKNPDMAELIRGKTGRVYGDLITLLTVMKGLPLAYNKDMQEDKEAVFDAVDTVKSCLGVFTGMLETAGFNADNMYKAAGGGFTNATDAADWLVKNGVAFRDAHEIVGRLVNLCAKENKSLEELSLDEYKSISPVFDETVFEALSLSACVNGRNAPGGPAGERVAEQIEMVEAFINGK